MIGTLYITGTIGDEYDIEGNLINKGVNLIDLIAQVKRQPDSERFNLYINSPGGDVQVGFDMYDYLKSLKRPIHSVGNGMVASIATIIFLSGDTREMRSGEFMVHLPSGGVFGDSDQIDEYSSMLKNIEKKIVKFYQDNAGLSEAEILPLMRNETWLNADEVFRLGITNIKPEVIKPVAYFNSKKSEMTETEKKGFMAEITNLIKMAKDAIIKPSNKIVYDAEQREVDFYELGETDPITVGAKARIDGANADGEILMADGETYVFAMGELVEIKTMEGEVTEEMEQMLAENQALKTELEELKASNSEMAEEVTTLQASNKALSAVVEKVKKLEAAMKFEDTKQKPKKIAEPDKTELGAAITNLFNKKKNGI